MMDVDDAHLNDEIYRLIAPRVGLHPGLRGNDITASTIYRARIPTPLFKAMVEDLGIVIDQYGGFCEHNNEEARSRFLAPVSAQSAFYSGFLNLLFFSFSIVLLLFSNQQL